MNGSGMKRSSARPIATVAPENRVARPAVRIVVTSASWADSCALELLPVAEHDQHRVVDRDREADQGDDVGHVDRHVHEVGEDPDRAQGGGDRHERECERDADRDQRPEHEGEDEQGDRDRDRLAASEVIVVDLLGVVVDRREAGEVGGGPGDLRRGVADRRSSCPPRRRCPAGC